MMLVPIAADGEVRRVHSMQMRDRRQVDIQMAVDQKSHVQVEIFCHADGFIVAADFVEQLSTEADVA